MRRSIYSRSIAAHQGFTLVEMLVAMALTLFVMVILSQAFIAALDTFRGLKAIGDMDESLRTAVTNLRADLQLEHFDGTRRLSDNPGMTNSPTQGFFLVYQGANGAAEANDPLDAISSYPNAAMTSYRNFTHRLHFTVKTRGNRPENFFSARVPLGSNLLIKKIDFYPSGNLTPYSQANTVTSRWAEVAYFMLPQGSTDSPNQTGGTGTPLYKLYRSQFLIVPDKSQLGGTSPPGYENVSCTVNGGGTLDFWTPDDQAGKPASPVFITNIAGNGSAATVTTSSAHNYSTNDIVRIAGAGTAALNGIFVITVINGTSFSYTNATNTGGTPDTSPGMTATRLQGTVTPPTRATRRFDPSAAVPDTTGATLLLSNVVSFSVQVMRTSDLDFVNLDSSGLPAMFDTAGENSPFARRVSGQPASPALSLNFQNNSSAIASLPSLAPTPISGVQISIRVWDARTQSTRQITIIQEM